MVIVPKKWIQFPDENGNGFLEAEFDGCVFDAPVPVETHNVAQEEVILGSKQEFSFIFEAASEVKIYTDEDAYNKEGTSMAPESYIPSGLFSPSEDPEFRKSPTAIISGKVTKTYEDPVQCGFDEEDTLLSMVVDGGEFDIVLHEKRYVSVGNIVKGVFWVQGWPNGT